MAIKTHALCQGLKGNIKILGRQVTLRKSKDQLVQAVSPAESLPNRPMLPKLAELQLLPPKLKFVSEGLLKAELSKRDGTLSCAGHLLKMLHLPVMPNGIQNQLKKVDCQLLGRRGKTLHKIHEYQCLKGRNKTGDTKQFAKELVAQPQTSFAKAQLKTSVLKSPTDPDKKNSPD